MIFAVPPGGAHHQPRHPRRVATSTEVGRVVRLHGRSCCSRFACRSPARPILLGINQVIMMAFGIVVYAALIGTGGVGNDVLGGLQKVDVGKAFAAGLAIVFAAIALDRITTSERHSRSVVSACSPRAPPRFAARRGSSAVPPSRFAGATSSPMARRRHLDAGRHASPTGEATTCRTGAHRRRHRDQRLPRHQLDGTVARVPGVAAMAGRRRRDRCDRLGERRVAARRHGCGLHVRHRRDGATCRVEPTVARRCGITR